MRQIYSVENQSFVDLPGDCFGLKGSRNEYFSRARQILLVALYLFPGLQADCAASVETSLKLDEYLGQVTQSNQDYRASVLVRAGAEERFREGSLLYSTQAFANLQHIDNSKPNSLSALMGSEQIEESLSFGVSKQFSFGLQTKLAYTITQTSLLGINTAMLSQFSGGAPFPTRYFDCGLSLELSQPFWKNAFGRATSLAVEAAESQAKAISYGESFKGKVTLAEAELRYWRLAIAREVIRVQRQSLDRAMSIRDYNGKRVRLELIDKADLLQSEAAVKARQLDLKLALDEERAAGRALNSGRGLDSEEVSEKLLLADSVAIAQLQIPARAAKRDDVKAAEEAMKAASAGSEMSRDKVQPSLDLVAVASVNGRDPAFGPSTSQSFGTQYPFALVGLKFAMPLDVGTTAAVRAGYLKEVQGAELGYQRKLFDQENNWKDLVQKFTEAKERLSIARALEEAQSVKLQEERKRQKEGRSTTFQVFMFEQEYLSSQLIRIQTQGLILGLMTQMRLYRGES